MDSRHAALPRSSGLRRRDRHARRVRGEFLRFGLTRERDDDRADECEAETDHGDDDMPARSVQTLVQEEDPIRIPTIGFATETVATEGERRPVPSDTCCNTKPSTPATARA